MAFTLRVEFSGPCVYVPSAAGEQFDELTVLMVDARTPDPGSQQASHLPVLLFELADLRPATSASFMPLEDGRRGAVFLDREEILLTGASDQAPLRVFNSPTLPDPLTVDRFGFNWMPRLEDVLTDSGNILPEALGDPPSPLLAARARLSSGALFTAKMSAQAGSYVDWTFKPSGETVVASDPARQIGLDVGLELRVDTEAKVILQRFDTGTRRVLSFASSGGEKVCLTFANREPGFVFSGTETGEPVSSDPDFEFLYRLSADPAIAGQPKPIPQVKSGGATRSGITCGGSVGNPGSG